MNIPTQNGEVNETDWTNIDSPTFWRKADKLQSEALRKSDVLFSCLASAPIETLKEILIQYRYFTIYYIPDLALLIAQLEDGPFRSFLAEILNDELGQGNPAHAHPQLYDNFLASIGVDVAKLEAYALADNVALLDEARRHLVDPNQSSEYAVGLRGMGGECVCQVYIAQLYKHLMRNEGIQQRQEQINWHFWDIHVGDHDVEHRERTRALIHQEIVKKGGEGLDALWYGYSYSVGQWEAFWKKTFDLEQLAGSTFMTPRGRVASSVNVTIHGEVA